MKKIFFVSLVIGLIGTIELRAAGSGFAFLKMPVAASSAATMGVFSQISKSPFSLFENPTGLQNSSFQVGASYTLWFADVRSNTIVGSFPIGKWTIGAGVNFVRIPGIEIRETPTTQPLGKVEAQYLATGLGLNYQLLKKLNVGVVGKFLYEHLYSYYTYGYALDIGGRFRAPSDLDISFLMCNIGSAKALKSEKAKLPTTLKIGIVRPEIFTEGPVNISVGINLVSVIPSQTTSLQAGVALFITEYLNLRGGFERIGNFNRYSTGLGIKIGKFSFDYALIFMPEGLGYPHLISLSFSPKSGE